MPGNYCSERALCGELSPDDAEAEAKRLGLGRLSRKPKESDFDPMSEPWWTLPMAIAWIVWRRPRLVLGFWDKYRFECWKWSSPINIESNGQTGYRLVQRGPATLRMLARLERDLDARPEEQLAKSRMSCGAAKAKFWRTLQEGTLQATGINFDTGRRVLIPSFEWHDLENVEEQGRNIVRVGNPAPRSLTSNSGRGTVAQIRRGRDGVDANRLLPAPAYVDVVVRRTEVMANWPSHEPTPADAAVGQLKAVESTPIKSNRRGTRLKYDWAEIEILVFDLMNKNGEFREWDIGSGWCVQADLERKVLSYFEDRVARGALQRAPGEGHIRTKVVEILARWREQQGPLKDNN
jgi:hypothetical protein